VCESFENDGVAAHEILQVGEPAQDIHVLDIGAPPAGIRVDEPHHVEPVFLVVDQLSCDELTDVPRADDDRVLDVREAPSGESSGGNACAGDEQDRKGPEDG